MDQLLREYATFLSQQKGMSANTISAYLSDLNKLATYLQESSCPSFFMVQKSDINQYFSFLTLKGASNSTISRQMTSVHSFFQYLFLVGKLNADPTAQLERPKTVRSLPATLSVSEIDKLLEAPDTSSFYGLRDKAMLEVLYATGMKVSEVISINIEDVQLQIGCLTCISGGNQERVVPLGRSALKSIEAWLKDGRLSVSKKEASQSLFINHHGRPLSRQGFWKIIKKYAKESGILTSITPNTLRHSFAVHMLENGADLKSVSELMGHTHLSTTQIYAQVTKTRLRDVYTKSHPRA
jgi:integrase/recombinase XerD